MFNLVYTDHCGAAYCLPAQDETSLMRLLDPFFNCNSGAIMTWAKTAQVGDVFVQKYTFWIFCCSGKETVSE